GCPSKPILPGTVSQARTWLSITSPLTARLIRACSKGQNRARRSESRQAMKHTRGKWFETALLLVAIWFLRVGVSLGQVSDPTKQADWPQWGGPHRDFK